MGAVKFTTLARASIFFIFTLTLEGKMRSLACLILIFLLKTITSEKYACPEYDTNFYGNDVSTVHTNDWRACGEVCSLVNDCSYWTYNDHKDEITRGTCFLKSSNAGLEYSEGDIAGEKACP